MVSSKIVLHSVVQIYELHVHSTKLSNLPLTDIICDRFCFYKVLKVHRTSPQKLSSPRLRLQVLRVKGCRRATILYSGKSTILCYSRADVASVCTSCCVLLRVVATQKLLDEV